VIEARRRVVGAEHPDTLTSQNNLAGVLRDLGRLEESEAEYRVVVDARGRVLGTEHPDTVASRRALDAVLTKLGRLTETDVN
jgi:hypothetical protein